MVAKERATLTLVYNRKPVRITLCFYVCVCGAPTCSLLLRPEDRLLVRAEQSSDAGHPPQAVPMRPGPALSVLEFGGGKKAFLFFMIAAPPVVRIISGGMQVDRRTTSLQFVFVCGFQGDISTTLWCSVGNRSMTGKMKSILILFLRHKSFIYSIVF